MSASLVRWTKKMDDLSDEQGFQFRFYCDRCGEPQESERVESKMGKASFWLTLMGQTVGMFYYPLRRVSSTATRINRSFSPEAKQNAYEKATEEVKARMKRCGRCTHWVCDNCWAEQMSLCLDCAAKAGMVMPSAGYGGMSPQMGMPMQGMGQQMMAPQFAAPMAAAVAAPAAGTMLCPRCGKMTPVRKFCGSCGGPLGSIKCECGEENSPDLRFCGGCGKKLR